MDVKYILVVLLIILFIVNVAIMFYINSQISSLQSSYNTVVSDYNTLKNEYSALYSNYSTVVSSYNSLASKYNTLESELTMTSGMLTVYSFYLSLSEINTVGMESELVGPYISFFEITSPPGNGTVIMTSSNASTAIPIIGKQLSEFFDYLSVKAELKELVVKAVQNNMIVGEGLLAFNDEYPNGTIITTYALVTTIAKDVNVTNWQVVYVKIDNSITEGYYSMVVALFNLLTALQSKNIGLAQEILVGPYSSYVYLAQGPYSGNYTGLAVLNTFLDQIVSHDIQSIQFTPCYYTLTPISPSEATIDMYGVLTITLVNGTSYTYYTQLHVIEELEPDGEPQVIGFNIMNNLTQEQLISVIPS